MRIPSTPIWIRRRCRLPRWALYLLPLTPMSIRSRTISLTSRRIIIKSQVYKSRFNYIQNIYLRRTKELIICIYVFYYLHMCLLLFAYEEKALGQIFEYIFCIFCVRMVVTELMYQLWCICFSFCLQIFCHKEKISYTVPDKQRSWVIDEHEIVTSDIQEKKQTNETSFMIQCK